MEGASRYWLPRLLFQHGLGLIYLIAFLVAVNQFRPLLGEHGLLPVPLFVKQVSFRDAPSLFFLFPNDRAFCAAAWIGVFLSGLALTGVSDRFGTWLSMLVWAILWLIYLSFVNVGQVFYGFGWESMLLEAGFFAIFLGSRNSAPRAVPIWILRWMLFRVMFGAGLIKLRGDACWKDLTCLDYHYETQPMPNLLSWYFHWAPAWTHHGGVWFNHFVELAIPFGYFAPQPIATIAGIFTIVFQLLLMFSGNLSFLNLLTIVLALPALDCRILSKIIPAHPPAFQPPGRAVRYGMVCLAAVVGILSIPPALNMLSPGQLMNFNYNPLHLVNTYGAFGSINRTRYEVAVEGTADPSPTPSTPWREYEFQGKPGDIGRRPPQIAPYHLRLDWLMWFAAMSRYTEEPWFVNLMAKLLQGDGGTLGLLRTNPFPDRPPRYVRARLYMYRFTTPEERQAGGEWWRRELVGPWFPEVSLDTPGFRRILLEQGWL
ncbi:MAG TPA: lipase maturation factor family protein [Bryobacteraceae bacterium]|nr:lipase maturation factor family protein [Bryobacteraceae bacterium]